MGSNVSRPDWGPGGETRNAVVPTSVPAVYTGHDVVVGNPDLARHVPGSSTDTTAGMNPGQIEVAAAAAQMMLSTCPYAYEFVELVDTLSPGLQGKIFRTMASHPHLRGLDLVEEIERTLNLSEQNEVERWLRSIAPAYRSWLCRGVTP